MSAISSTSTLAEIEAAYDDNASYAEDLSVDKCRVFMTACRILLRRSFSDTSDQGSSLKRNTSHIQNELDRATEWLSENGTNQIESGRSDFTRGRAL